MAVFFASRYLVAPPAAPSEFVMRSRLSPLPPSLSALALALFTLGACGVAPESADDGAPCPPGMEESASCGPTRVVGDVLVNPPRPPAGPSDDGLGALQQALGPNGHHVIYLDFDGTTLTGGYDDATRNVSSIVYSINKSSITVPAFDPSWYSTSKTRDQVVADITALVRTYYAPFNVDIVTARPTSGDYVMVAVGGLPGLINQPCGQASCVLGLAPLDCQTTSRGITYNSQGDKEVVLAFSDAAQYQRGANYDMKVQIVAVTIAQESAHAYGLGHVNSNTDIMSPTATGQATGFNNQAVAYADNMNCANGQGTQNSYQLLMQILGPAEPDATPPTVAIVAPKDGATVGRSFTAQIQASDDQAVASVKLVLTGAGAMQTTTLSTAPYQWNVTVDSDGAWQLQATATDVAGNAASATSRFTVSGSVQGGGVDMAPGPGELGATCQSDGECHANYCVRGLCSLSCDPRDAMSCPEGQKCVAAADGRPYCASPQGKNASKGCSVGSGLGGESGAPAVGLVLVGLALVLRRRRVPGA